MESESADGAGEAVRGAPLIFFSDASAEAERLSSALRARGYLVTDVPLSMLAGRLAVQRPDLALCDADAPEFADTFERLRDLGLRRLPILLLGDRNGPIAKLEAGLVAGVFARPVNTQELLGTVERLVGAGIPPGPTSSPPSGRGGTKVATSSRPPARSSIPVGRLTSDRARLEGSGAASVPLPPDLAGDVVPVVREAGDAPSVELAADIQQILLDAEARFRARPATPASGSDDPGPELNAEGPVALEVLVALDEPLDDEDIGGEGTPAPSLDGTGSISTAKGAVRGYTQAGGGTAFSGGTSLNTGIGTDAAGAPFSDSIGSIGPLTGPGATSAVGPEPPLSSEADGPESRLARQRASTPRPPKPMQADGENDDRGAAIERGSAPPPVTSPDHPVPEAPASAGTSILAPPSLRGAHVTEPPAPQDRPGARPRVELNFDSDPPEERRDLSSTAPPLRGASQGDPSVAPKRESEVPPAPATAPPSRPRESDRPSAPRAEAPGYRESERPPVRTDHPPERRDAERDGGGPAAPGLELPVPLRAGDAVARLAKAIGSRYSGALALEVDEGIRRVVFREGDFVTVTSGVHAESLVAFLVGRGDLPAEVARQAHKLPAFGRRAGAALIAHGHLAQDQLWPVLRAHAEWLIGRILGIERGAVHVEDVGRLQDEPAVFGGATGAEVLVEVVRRMVPAEDAIARLGGANAELSFGGARALLGECALVPLEAERVQQAEGSTVRDLVASSPDPSFAAALTALVALDVLRVEGPRRVPAPAAEKPERDELDDAALRTRILARKSLVDDGDYFAVLGVARDATSYDIRRAYSALRREFDPHRALTAATADLGDAVDEIVAVLEEAYQILSDQRRRERYRRAIEASP